MLDQVVLVDVLQHIHSKLHQLLHCSLRWIRLTELNQTVDRSNIWPIDLEVGVDIKFIRSYEIFNLFTKKLPMLFPNCVDYYFVYCGVQFFMFWNVVVNKFVHFLKCYLTALFICFKLENFKVRSAWLFNKLLKNDEILFQPRKHLFIS